MRGTWSRLRYRIGAVPSLRFASMAVEEASLDWGIPGTTGPKSDSSHIPSSPAVSSDLTCPAQIRPEQLQLQLNQPLSSLSCLQWY